VSHQNARPPEAPTPRTRLEIAIWAAAYVDVLDDPEQRREHHPGWWAVETASLLLGTTDADSLWAFVLAVLKQHPSEAVMSSLAAGPLTELIGFAGANSYTFSAHFNRPPRGYL
jgi:uncharacterized protein DUF6869